MHDRFATAQAIPATGEPPRLTVGILLAENVTLSAFALFVDQLRLAADEGDMSRPIRCQWWVMSSRAEPVRASCGAAIGRTSGLIDPRRLDYVVVVGGLLHGSRQVDDETIAYLRGAARAGTTLVGICTGSFVLCRAGLMKGRPVCVSWYHYQDFLDEFPDHVVFADRPFLVDGDRITCAGGIGSADLGSFLVERHVGRAAAQKSRHVLLLENTNGEDGAQPHPPMVREVTDTRVRRALLLMEQNLSDPLPIAALAARLGLSVRQLERLFQTALGQRPATLYRALRLRYAGWLLDNTARSVTDIAIEAGFSDCAHFSRQFKALHGFNPTDNRAVSGRRCTAPERQMAAGVAAQLAAHRMFD